MQEIREPLFDKKQTSDAIYNLIKMFSDDLKNIFLESEGDKIPLADLPVTDFFNLVKNIPYRKDEKPIEVIARPYYILKHRQLGMDCKKKSVLMGSYFKINKIPFRFIGSSRRTDKKIHHIFPQAKLSPDGTPSDEFVNFDATYSVNFPGMSKEVTAWEIL